MTHHYLEKFSVKIPNRNSRQNNTIQEHLDYTEGEFEQAPFKSIRLVLPNTKMTVKEIYFYKKTLCCSGYYVIASFDSLKNNKILVNLAMLFEVHGVSEEGDSLIYKLNQEYAEICSN